MAAPGLMMAGRTGDVMSTTQTRNAVDPIYNPRLWGLASRAEPLRRDRVDLCRLVERHGREIPLGQLLDRVRGDLNVISDEYQAMKARGEAL